MDGAGPPEGSTPARLPRLAVDKRGGLAFNCRFFFSGEWALKRTALIFSLLALAVAGVPNYAQAAIINVTAGAVDTTVNGNCSLIEAIQAANTDSAVDACTAGTGFDIIVVPAGTYTLTAAFGNGADANPVGLPPVTTAMRIDGANAATTIIERDPMGPAFRLFDVSGGGDLGLRFLTVRNGSSPSGAALRFAGSGSIFLSQMVFDNNAVTGGNGNGGAVELITFMDQPPMQAEIVQVTFSNNSADLNGGAILVSATTAVLDIENSSFTGNAGESGGALRINDGAAITCLRCVFASNTADISGGAISSRGALTLTDSLVTGNTAEFSGGGLTALDSAVIQIDGTTFSGNACAQGSGGGLFLGSASATTIVNSTFSGNSAAGMSGAIHGSGASLSLNNVTIASNSADVAGGLEVGSGTPTFANTIIAANSASLASPDCIIDAPATLTSMGFNLVGDNTGCNFTPATGDQVGTGGAPIDAMLGALADNGGPDAGATPVPIPTHFPQPGSPALDAGNNVDMIGGAFPACRADDQRDVARPVGPRCDIGAVESTVDVDVAITKTDSPDPVNRGDNITYTLTVTNNGPGSAGDVTVTDSLPAGLNFVSATPSQGMCNEAGGTVTCNLAILASGANATVGIVVTTTAAGMVTNTATVSTTSNDTNATNDSDTETTVVNPATDISVTKTDSADPVNVGDNITYTVTATNNGPDNATGVSLMDTLPGSVNFVSATPSQGMCAQAGGVVTCNLGAVGNGNNATVSIVVTTTANAIITNTVTVTADGADTNPANNQASQSTSVGANADLILSVADSPDPIPINGNLTYTLTVANAGPAQATNVTLTDTLPTGVSFSSANSSQGTCTQAMGVVTCSIGTLAAQASATATIVGAVNVQNAAVITNSASVTLTEADPNLANNTVSSTTTVVDFTISVMPASVTVTRGNTAVYTVTLTPAPPGGRYDFAITLTCEMLPSNTTCAFVPGSAIPGGISVTSTLSVITTAPGSASLRPPMQTLLYAVWLLGPLGLLVLSAGPRRRGRAILGLLLLILVLQAGCGGSNEPMMPAPNPGTPTGTHTFTIRGTTGQLFRTANANVVVQ